MIVTESALREQLRRPRLGAAVSVPPGAVLTPAAQDFVAQWRLEIEEAPTPSAPAVHATDWDRPSTFPIVRDGELPRCTACGEPVRDKPDRMTQLDACHFAPKTAPRIRLRGRLDSVQALALLAGSRAYASGEGSLASRLDTIAAYCRELLAAEYHEREAAPVELDGHDAAQLQALTHDPESMLGIGHVLPSVVDPELLHWLNVLRAEVREVEIVALDAFPSPHDLSGASIVHGLNRLSSAVYYLELRLAAGTGART